MGVLTSTQIVSRINSGELLRNFRRTTDGRPDIEADSYDLAAGTAIWKQPSVDRDQQIVKTLEYSPEPSAGPQPSVTVQPGQMIFVVTYEDVLMPFDLCGTVYSRNKLALQGILALNAGHVDPGYQGPITIRLINLRSIPWTLTLGEPIFTITFQTIDADLENPSSYARYVSQEDMIVRVRDTADASLSNALYDLYATEIGIRLNEYKANALAEFRNEGDDRWIRKDGIWPYLFNSILKVVVAIIGFAMVVAAGIAGILYTFDFVAKNLPQ